MDRLLRGHNVAYVAAASVVVLICWLVFVAVQPPPPAEEEEADTDTPAGRRAERHKRMLQRAKTVAASKAAEGRAAKVKAVRTTFLVETDAMDVNVTVVRPEDQHTLTIVTVHGAGANQFPQHAPPAWRHAPPRVASQRRTTAQHSVDLRAKCARSLALHTSRCAKGARWWVRHVTHTLHLPRTCAVCAH